MPTKSDVAPTGEHQENQTPPEQHQQGYSSGIKILHAWLRTIREPFGQPIMALITEREKVYNKHFSPSTPSPYGDSQIAVEMSCPSNDKNLETIEEIFFVVLIIPTMDIFLILMTNYVYNYNYFYDD